MSDQYVGEIRLFAGKVVPSGWHICDGSMLNIKDNDVLYAIIGTTYGGDGVTSFALPNMLSRAPMHQGTGIGLTSRIIGMKLGNESVSITQSNLPYHSHTFYASARNADSQTIQGNVLAITPTSDLFYVPKSTTTPPLETNLINGVIGNTGGNASHENRMPYLAISYIIALTGIFPTQE